MPDDKYNWTYSKEEKPGKKDIYEIDEVLEILDEYGKIAEEFNKYTKIEHQCHKERYPRIFLVEKDIYSTGCVFQCPYCGSVIPRPEVKSQMPEVTEEEQHDGLMHLFCGKCGESGVNCKCQKEEDDE